MIGRWLSSSPSLRALLAAALVAIALPSFGADRVSEQLVVTGALKTPLRLKVEDLSGFPATQIETVKVMRGPPGNRLESTLRGVRLTAVLERAGLAATDHNDWKHTVVLATATDGYQVAFSWPELFDTEVGAGAFVVFERDGQPLDEREGRIALVSARDRTPGPRSVRSLATLDVRVLK